ncbi:hypothetical protein ANN_16208 [Periplaneta americana]|uniref:Uncharacterized protein n=1 Tax=Periplaneta americana TaxID=6978 RepID=A0ABQ8SJF3_PERAM|nr:hypothetical protein ANN_16208 [Periplaneta americana]
MLYPLSHTGYHPGVGQNLLRLSSNSWVPSGGRPLHYVIDVYERRTEVHTCAESRYTAQNGRQSRQVHQLLQTKLAVGGKGNPYRKVQMRQPRLGNTLLLFDGTARDHAMCDVSSRRPIFLKASTRSDDSVTMQQSGFFPTDYLNKIENWLINWKIETIACKSSVVIFTKRRPQEPFELKLFDVVIPNQNETTYLGILLDHRLSFKPHMNKIAAKGYAMFQRSYPLFKSPSLSLWTKKTFYTTIIRASLLYAYPARSSFCQWVSTEKTAWCTKNSSADNCWS